VTRKIIKKYLVITQVFCHSLFAMKDITLELLKALEELHGVLDLKTHSGLAVNQEISKEVFNKFYQPAINARIVIEKAKNVLDTLQ
jgi:tRNA(Ile2) C34 agmatinyltransferase TiaS